MDKINLDLFSTDYYSRPMIRLNRLTDYAVNLLSQMGRAGEGHLWSASDLAATSGLPSPTVSKILKTLSKKGIIVAQRGATGGYRLAAQITKISLADIIEALDGPIAITDCAEGSVHPACNIQDVCPMSGGWNKVNRAIRTALNSVSLADMDAPASLPGTTPTSRRIGTRH